MARKREDPDDESVLARAEQPASFSWAGGPSAVDGILALQRSAGNAAVADAIRSVGHPALSRAVLAPGHAHTIAPLMRATKHAAARRTLARTTLADYNDSDPQHDPSHVADSDIMATDEYKELSTKTFPPLLNPAPHEHVLLACRLMLRSMRDSGMLVVTAMPDAQKFLTLAEQQLGTLQETENQVGHLNWTPFSTKDAVSDPSKLPTEFGRWVLAGGPMPDKLSGSINCWEMVLFGAFKAGFITFTRIQEIYKLGVEDVKAKRTTSIGDTVEQQLQGSSPRVFDPDDPDSPAPLAGDLVVFQRAAVHMAIATGKVSGSKHGVISLWTMPGNISTTQQTTIEDLLGAMGGGAAGKPVKFWTAKW